MEKNGKQYTRSKKAYANALQDFEKRLQAETEKRSTGAEGKRFDNARRNSTRMAQGKRIDANTVRAMGGGAWDDRLKIDGHFYDIEIKSSMFAQWEYGATKESAWAAFYDRMRYNDRLIFEVLYDGAVTMVKAVEFFDMLEQYNPTKGLAVWFDYKKPTAKRTGQIQMQPVMAAGKITSAKRKAYLEKVLWEIGYDADTVRQTLSFE